MKSEVWVPVYSEQELSPKAQDVIRGIISDGFPDHVVKFREWYPGYSQEKQVLVFGKITAPYTDKRTKFVYTYSIAQVMTKANAATVVKAGIRQFITEPEKPPFDKPQYTWSPAEFNIRAWDFDEPAVIDIETDGNLGVTETPEEVKIISVAIYQKGLFPQVLVGKWSGERTEPLDENALAVLRRLLPKFTKAIYHNGKFDTRVLNRVLGVKLTVWFDTMLAHHVLNHAAGDHKLKHLARQYFGAPDWEAGINKFITGGGHYERIPADELSKYNGWDVYWTYKLWELLAPQIEADEDNEKAFMLEMSYAEFLLDVEKTGIPFDIDYAGVLGSELLHKAEFDRDTLRVITDNEKFNPGSWMQVKKWLASQGHEVASTDEDHITELKNSLHERNDVWYFCDVLLRYRKATKMRSTYVQGWWKHARRGRVHPTFLVHGTSTGRLSSTGPNAQNVPREKSIRRLVALNEEDQSTEGPAGG